MFFLHSSMVDLERQARELFKNAAEVVSRYAEVGGPGDFHLVAIP